MECQTRLKKSIRKLRIKTKVTIIIKVILLWEGGKIEHLKKLEDI